MGKWEAGVPYLTDHLKNGADYHGMRSHGKVSSGVTKGYINTSCIPQCSGMVSAAQYSVLWFMFLPPPFMLALGPGMQHVWCPHIPDVTVGACNPAAPWLFIWSPGRSGSTTLLDMVNLLPGVYLTGENRMAEPASKLWWSWYLQTARRRQGQGEDGASQRGQLEFAPFQCALQDWFSAIPPVRSINETDTVVVRGWKDDHFRPAHMQFLQEVFPCSRFVFSIRLNVTEQAGSGHFRGQVAPGSLAQQNRAILRMHRDLGPRRSHVFPLEEFDASSFQRLFEWLGFDDCRPAGILHDNRQGWTADRSTDRALLLPPGCAFTGSRHNPRADVKSA